MSSLNSLTAISPIDGRYFSDTKSLSNYFSESAFIRYRLMVEVEYFIALCNYPLPELNKFPKEKTGDLRKLYEKWDLKKAEEIKEIEKTTNHDVKAIEYYLKSQFDNMGLQAYREFIHFGLTSQDINNTAMPLLLREFLKKELMPLITDLLKELSSQASSWKTIPMLARTHGQPASSTYLGKEIEVFTVRIENQLKVLSQIPHCAKFGGSVGNFNAHKVAYPQVDWFAFGDHFVKKHFHLVRSHPTTQIEHYDNMAAIFDTWKRINTILIDYSRDLWQYIAMNYFKQQPIKQETGSSTMPHKINPIDFENAEGNLGLANAVLGHLSSKLPISRLQRDLTDSTVMRNIGVPFAHMHIAFTSLRKGIEKLTLNEKALQNDLEENWMIVAEGIQTILRREKYDRPYEALKALTRTHKKIAKKEMHDFIHSLKISEKVKQELLAITPFNYTGM